MQNFDIIKKSDIKQTYRVARIMSDFDVKTEHTNERFTGQLDLPEKWSIGVIVGASGTGKTTIAKELFSDCYVKDLIYTASSVIDDMPKNVAVVQRAIAELEKYKKAFELACREVASYTVCIWCDDNSGCDNCKILQSIKAKFLGWTEADDE